MSKILGAHMSIAGQLGNCFDRAKAVGCDCLQIFTKSSNRWQAKPLTDLETSHFAKQWQESGLGPVIAHDSYLINLGSPDEELWLKSIAAFEVELERCRLLRIDYLVMHPGSHVGSGEAAGLKRIAQAIDILHQKLPELITKITLETTAGQGTNLGYRFEQLAAIIEQTEEPERLRVCFDTCHTFAAGYDLRSESGYEQVFEDFDRIIGLDRLVAFHLNDSQKDLSCKVDRHAHIGEGFLGLDFFKRLMNDSRFDKLPMVLETPKGENNQNEDWDLINLNLLRSLIKQPK